MLEACLHFEVNVIAIILGHKSISQRGEFRRSRSHRAKVITVHPIYCLYTYENKHISLSWRWGCWFSSNSKVIQNDVRILTSGCDLGPGPLLDIKDTSGLVEPSPPPPQLLDSCWLSINGSDDTLTAFKNHFKTTFLMDC